MHKIAKAWILGFSFTLSGLGDSSIAFSHLIRLKGPQVPAADARSNQPIEANPAPEQRKAWSLPSRARKARVHTKPGIALRMGPSLMLYCIGNVNEGYARTCGFWGR